MKKIISDRVLNAVVAIGFVAVGSFLALAALKFFVSLPTGDAAAAAPLAGDGSVLASHALQAATETATVPPPTATPVPQVFLRVEVQVYKGGSLWGPAPEGIQVNISPWTTSEAQPSSVWHSGRTAHYETDDSVWVSVAGFGPLDQGAYWVWIETATLPSGCRVWTSPIGGHSASVYHLVGLFHRADQERELDKFQIVCPFVQAPAPSPTFIPGQTFTPPAITSIPGPSVTPGGPTVTPCQNCGQVTETPGPTETPGTEPSATPCCATPGTPVPTPTENVGPSPTPVDQGCGECSTPSTPVPQPTGPATQPTAVDEGGGGSGSDRNPAPTSVDDSTKNSTEEPQPQAFSAPR